MVKLRVRPPVLTVDLRQAFEQFLDEQGDRIFIRSDLARYLYPLTEPRSRGGAGYLADLLIRQSCEEGKLVRRGHRYWGRPGSRRRLLSGAEIEELDVPVELIVRTRVPEKWLAADLETGELWVAGVTRQWVRLPAPARLEVLHALSGVSAGKGDGGKDRTV
ncbi:hypothetical protein D3M96_02640 [Alcaligenes aquatilis]|uniref:Uncharacterized protein n=1 Tax=Alcaligenes aquatilis TaxID=323284 RepID=A0A3G2HS02_9BURK|nr:hypothetical protein D3M96_02640 [Alcaligenes aquatilis]